MMSTIPVAGTVSVFKTNEDSKERILFTLQIAVKQIQHYSSLQNEEECLSAEIHEVKQLCQSLDNALFHGLKSFDQGYWSFVKEFTHGNTVKFLEKLDNISTKVQRGRAWLCLALNEASLESYFRSFMQNTKVVKKYYESPALLCDEQRMQLVLMLMAGLEFVPINLNVGKICYGSGLSFIENNAPNFPVSKILQPYEYPMKEIKKPNVILSSNTIPFDSAVEVTGDFTVVETSPVECKTHVLTADNVLHKSNSYEASKILSETVSQEDLERITHYINIDAESDKPNEDLEVIRTKVVRRTKKSASSKSTTDCTCSDGNTQLSSESNSSLENRLSKATTDSGLCLETPYSSDSESMEFTDGAIHFKDIQNTFETAEFRQDINITFSVPKIGDDLNFNGKNSSIEERGNPEGQEDPITNVCTSQDSNRLPLLHGDDGVDGTCDELEEEEISIYDLCKASYFIQSTPTNSQIPKLQSNGHKILHYPNAVSSVDDVSEELAKLASEKPEDLDFSVGNNILLYFLVEIYEHEEENFYKLYCGYSNFPEGYYLRVYFLLSNKGVYFLKPGNQEQKFLKCGSLRYSSIDYIMVDLNYQGFKIVSGNKDNFLLHTADGDLTKNILSSMEIGIRRFIPKLPLPSVYTDAMSQTIVLEKFLAPELDCEKSNVNLQHYVLARWEDYTSSSITPSGPIYQDYLMYRHKFAEENKTTPWQPGYFLLKAGVLYCMEDEKSKPLFFIQMCAPHCQGCRRIHLLNRPNAFEIIRENRDSLQLAAADTYEASKWLQCFLETVSLAGHFIDTEKNVQRPCCVLFANDRIIIALEEPQKCSLKLLGRACLCDLVSVFVDPLASNFLMLEFEIAEASKSSGEWIIYFESVFEKEKFLHIISQRWSEIFQVSLSVENVKDLYLLKKYRQIAEELNRERKSLKDYCTDN